MNKICQRCRHGKVCRFTAEDECKHYYSEWQSPKEGIMLACFALIFLAVLSMLVGCNEEQSVQQVNIKPIDQHLVPTRQDWKDAYGDTLETQMAYNLVVFRNNDLIIANVMNRMHPTDVNDPNNLKARIEALEEKTYEWDTRSPSEMGAKMKVRDAKNRSSLNPIEGQLRWIPKIGRKRGYLQQYDGKEWITVE